MIKSFNSWKELNESLVNGLAELKNSSGDTEKIAWDVLSKDTFIIKSIDSSTLINQNGNITDSGWTFIKGTLNTQTSFINSLGGKLESFIPNKIFVYSVFNEKNQTTNISYNKIIFKLVDRPEKIDNTLEIMSNSNYGTIINTPEAISIANKLISDVRSNNTTGTPEIIKTVISPSINTSNEELNTFMYTSRTNQTTYNLEYDKEDNVIDAESVEGSGPDGTLEYVNGNIIFHPEVKGATPFTITNQQDKQFFIDIFTKPEFRSSLAHEQKQINGNTEITVNNIKDFLYDRSENPLFGTQEYGEKIEDNSPMSKDKLASMVKGLTKPQTK